MRSTPILLTIGITIALLFAAIPATQAFVSDAPIVGIYLQSDGAGKPALGFQPASQATAVNIPLLKGDGELREPLAPVCPSNGVCTPPLTFPRPCASAAAQQPVACAASLLGKTVVPKGFTVAGNSALTVWLKADNPTALESIQFVLQSVDGKNITTLATYGLDSGQGGELRPAPIQLGSTATPLTLGARFSGPRTAETGHEIQLLVSSVKTLVSTNSAAPSQVSVVYSKTQPSGALLPVAPPDSLVVFSQMQRGENTMGLYLGNGTLDFAAPTNETVRARTFTGAVNPSGATDMFWGAAKPDENSTIVGNAIYTVFAKVVGAEVGGEADGPGVLAGLQIKVSLKVNQSVFAATSHAMPTLLQTNGEAWFIGSIPIPRTNATTDMPIDVGISFIGAKPNGDLQILWGAPSHASGLLIPVEGGGHYFPPVEPTVNVTVPQAPPTPNATPATSTPAPEPEAGPQDDNETEQEGQDSEGQNAAGDPATVKQVSKAPTPGPSLAVFLLIGAAGLMLARRRK